MVLQGLTRGFRTHRQTPILVQSKGASTMAANNTRRPRTSALRSAGIGLLLGLLTLLLTVVPVAAGPASITANPNPVVIPFGESTSSVTIAWNSGTSAVPEFWVSFDGGPDTFFPIISTAAGSYVATVGYGHTYTARLYTAGHGTLLASVVIYTARPNLRFPITKIAYNPDPGCIVCGQIDPRSLVVDPAVVNPAVNRVTDPAANLSVAFK
jgi:hypothetical protein